MKTEYKLANAITSKSHAEIEKVFEEIYYEYNSLVYFIVANNVNNPLDVEEIVNDVFAKFYKVILNHEKISSITSYLSVISKNLVVDFYRKTEPKTISLDQHEIELPENNPTNNQNEVITNFFIKVDGVISDEDVKLIYEHLINNYSFSELSKKYKISRNTLKSRYLRSIKKIKEHMANE